MTIFTNSQWWHNLRGNTPVFVHLRGRRRAGSVEVTVEDKDAIAQYLRAMLQRSPKSAGFYQVTLDADGQPDSTRVRWSAQDKVMIRIHLYYEDVANND